MDSYIHLRKVTMRQFKICRTFKIFPLFVCKDSKLFSTKWFQIYTKFISPWHLLWATACRHFCSILRLPQQPIATVEINAIQLGFFEVFLWFEPVHRFHKVWKQKKSISSAIWFSWLSKETSNIPTMIEGPLLWKHFTICSENAIFNVEGRPKPFKDQNSNSTASFFHSFLVPNFAKNSSKKVFFQHVNSDGRFLWHPTQLVLDAFWNNSQPFYS